MEEQKHCKVACITEKERKVPKQKGEGRAVRNGRKGVDKSKSHWSESGKGYSWFVPQMPCVAKPGDPELEEPMPVAKRN